ncbi:hypothetical protein Tco_1467065 [Tanacetum coccineum]
MKSLNSNSQERELYQLQQMQHKAKESCMKSFRLLQSHLQVLSYNDLKINGCIERAFATLFEQDVQTFTGIMLLNLDQLEKQLDKDEFQGDRSMAALCVINKQFQMFIDSQFTWDYDKCIFVKDHNDSLIAQVNSKTVENADLKAQIQEQVFANVALKNELRKLKGNSENTKFAKSSILGKPVLQPLRNQSVVRQPTAFRSEQPKFSKPRNSSNESYGLNDMAHKYYLEVAKKKTQDKNMNLKPSVMHTTRLQNTANGSKPKSRSNNQTSKSLPVPKINHGMLNGVTLVDHSKNSSSFSDSKHFVCLTCQKCVFNANHDDCITKFLKEVNSRAKVQSPKSRNNIKPAKRIPNVNKPERRISKGYRFSPNKSFDVHKEPNTPRSCLRWKPTGRIFKFVGLRWIPTGKMFTDGTTKVDSEPPNGLNDDITNPYECDQTLNVNACTLNLSAGPRPQLMTPGTINLGLMQNIPSPTPTVPPTKIDRDLLFQAMFDEYFKAPPNVDHPVPDIPTLVPAASTSSPSSTTVDQDAPSTSTSQTTSEQQSSVIPKGVEDDFYDIEVAHMDNDPYFSILVPEPSSEETTLQGVITSNLHHLNHTRTTNYRHTPPAPKGEGGRRVSGIKPTPTS